MLTWRRPQRASSSTKVAAKVWVTCGSVMTGRISVTCLHGFSQHGDSWDELISLVPGRYRWLTPDLSGASPDSVAREVLEIWDREAVDRSHLVGYSQGGRIALYLATRHPDRLLTLTAIAAHAGLEGRERLARLAEDQALADRIESEGIDWFASYWAARPLFAGLARRGPSFLQRLDASRLRNQTGQLAAALRGLGQGAMLPFWDRLGEVEAPALILAGADDPRYIEFARRLARVLPHSQLAIVPGAGHAVHLEQPEAVAELLNRHLSNR